MIHSISMSADFMRWLNELKDKSLYFRILSYLSYMKNGELGDIKNVGDDIFETNIPTCPNLNLYFSKVYNVITILLATNSSSPQSEYVAKAKQIEKTYNDAALTRTKALCEKYGLEYPSNLASIG